MDKFRLQRKPGQKFVGSVKFGGHHLFDYDGVGMLQANGTLEVFDQFFSEQKFDRVIELGTKYGGFTLFLSKYHGKKLYSFDVNGNAVKRPTKKELQKVGVTLCFQNVFKSKNLKKLIEDSKGKRVILLCDNGNKVREVQIFGPMLKPGDIIMAHDYFRNPDIYYDQSLWKACEIIEKHIDSKIMPPFEPYAKKFEKVFWACRERV